jgi:hypothetical protein
LPVLLEELAPTPRRMEHRDPRFGEDGAIGWLQHRPMNGVVTLCRHAREATASRAVGSRDEDERLEKKNHVTM